MNLTFEDEIDESPNVELIEMVDKRYDLKRQMKALQAELDEIDDYLKEELAEDEIVYGFHGIGYELKIVKRTTIKPAIEWLEQAHPAIFKRFTEQQGVSEFPQLQEKIAPGAKLF